MKIVNFFLYVVFSNNNHKPAAQPDIKSLIEKNEVSELSNGVELVIF